MVSLEVYITIYEEKNRRRNSFCKIPHGKPAIPKFVFPRSIEISDITTDLPRLFKRLHSETHTAMGIWPCVRSLPESIPVRRRKEILGTHLTDTTIVCIDVDKPEETTGMSFSDAVAYMVSQYVPPELQGARMVAKASSSFFYKGENKFHLFFQLKTPVNFETWKAFTLLNFPDLVDVQAMNLAQPLFTSVVEEYWAKGPELWVKEGHLLEVSQEYYLPPKPSNREVKFNGDMTLIPRANIANKSISKKLETMDLSSNSRGKTFRAYALQWGSFYNANEGSTDFEERLLRERPEKAYHLKDKPSEAFSHLVKLSFDDFDYEEKEIDGYINLDGLVSNSANETDTVSINAIKGVTGVGKTYGMTQKFPSGPALIVSPTKLLVNQNAEAFNAREIHGDIKGEDFQFSLTHYDRFSTTIHSFYKLDHYWSHPWEVVFIDEAAQVLKALIGLDEEVYKKNLDLLRNAFQCAKCVVIADADLTNTTLKQFERLLDFPLNWHVQNIYKKDHIGRECFIYESSQDLYWNLTKSLQSGKRCLVIIDNPSTALARGIAYRDTYAKTGFVFTREQTSEKGSCGSLDELEEVILSGDAATVGGANFKENPARFCSITKPDFLCCSPILKSGVSFEHYFDEVFVVASAAHLSSGDIIQMVSRERHWDKAHIFTHTIEQRPPLPVDGSTDKENAWREIETEKVQGLRIRTFSVAVRLAHRGCKVTGVMAQNYIERPSTTCPKYAAKGTVGRGELEEYVSKQLCGKSKSSLQKKVDRFHKLKARSDEITNPWVTYNFIRENEAIFSDSGGYKQWAKIKEIYKHYGMTLDCPTPPQAKRMRDSKGVRETFLAECKVSMDHFNDASNNLTTITLILDQYDKLEVRTEEGLRALIDANRNEEKH